MNIFSQFIDIIYPPRCHICQKFLWKNSVRKDEEPIGFCQPCLDGFSEITSPLCPICGRPFLSGVEEDHLCEDCLRKNPVYDAVLAPYLYEGSLMTAIHHFKYAGKSYLANAFPLLASFAKKWLNKAGGRLIVPIPLHSKRLRKRGFNQSLLLARQMSSRLATELDFLSLRRIKYT